MMIKVYIFSIDKVCVCDRVSCISGGGLRHCSREEGLELLIFLILLQIYTSTFGLWGAEDPAQGFEHAREILYQCSYIPRP